MHDRAVREGVARAVVVRDHDVHPGRPRHRRLLDRGDAVVDGDHELGPVGRQPLDGLGGQAVAVLHAAGQAPARVGTKSRSVRTSIAVDDTPSTS